MANGVRLSRLGNSYRVSKLLKGLPRVRLERMLGLVLFWFFFFFLLFCGVFFLFVWFFKMLLRCQEALLYTAPGPWALKPARTNLKEIVFPIPPAGLGTFCSKAAVIFVGVWKDPWSILCLGQGISHQARELMTEGQRSIVLPRSARGGCWWLSVPSVIAAPASASFMC